MSGHLLHLALLVPALGKPAACEETSIHRSLQAARRGLRKHIQVNIIDTQATSNTLQGDATTIGDEVLGVSSASRHGNDLSSLSESLRNLAQATYPFQDNNNSTAEAPSRPAERLSAARSRRLSPEHSTADSLLPLFLVLGAIVISVFLILRARYVMRRRRERTSREQQLNDRRREDRVRWVPVEPVHGATEDMPVPSELLTPRGTHFLPMHMQSATEEVNTNGEETFEDIASPSGSDTQPTLLSMHTGSFQGSFRGHNRMFSLDSLGGREASQPQLFRNTSQGSFRGHNRILSVDSTAGRDAVPENIYVPSAGVNADVNATDHRDRPESGRVLSSRTESGRLQGSSPTHRQLQQSQSQCGARGGFIRRASRSLTGVSFDPSQFARMWSREASIPLSDQG